MTITMQAAIINGERASGAQQARFEACLHQRKEGLLHAFMDERNYLIMDYQTKAGNFIRAKYNFTGALISKRAFRQYDHETKTPLKEIKFYE
jgi:phage gp37-like protein